MPDDSETMFCHSRCCNAHWELVITPDGKCDLRCEDCGKSIGPSVLVTYISEKPPACERCGKPPTDA